MVLQRLMFQETPKTNMEPAAITRTWKPENHHLKLKPCVFGEFDTLKFMTTITPEKWMVGQPSFPFGQVTFQGRAVK